MPCIYCNTIKSPNTLTHTLSRCVEPADEVMGPIITCFTTYPCDIIHQTSELSKYSKGQLAMVCKKIETHFSGTKIFLIGAIIRQFFRRRVLMNILSPSFIITVDDISDFNESYDTIYASQPCELRTSLINTMESLYVRIFGERRNGVDYQHLTEILLRNKSSSHLSKLTIQVEVDQSMSENKECDICCGDENPTAKMGCSHEFCVECVHKLCTSRTKSFILCPMCRGEISHIQVGTIESSQILCEQIMRC